MRRIVIQIESTARVSDPKVTWKVKGLLRPGQRRSAGTLPPLEWQVTKGRVPVKMEVNGLGQPVGPSVPGWQPRPPPPRSAIEGRLCRLEPLDPERHADELHAAFSEDREGRLWTYLPYGPFETAAKYRGFIEAHCLDDEPLFFAIVRLSEGRALGVASLLRIDPENGSIEVGNLCYSSALQRSAVATEAMYLLARRAFDELGYRRYEWKCDAANAASRAAAQRLGFRYEGIFRQAIVYKGRNRDTAWFSILDSEWPAVREALERWLRPENFDAEGRQRVSLLRVGESSTRA